MCKSLMCKRSQCLGEDVGQNFVEHVENLKLPLDEVSVGVARGPADEHDEIAMASRGCRYDWSADVGGQVGIRLAPLLSLRISFGKAARLRILDQLAHIAVSRKIVPRSLSFFKGKTCEDVLHLEHEGKEDGRLQVPKDVDDDVPLDLHLEHDGKEDGCLQMP